MIRAEKKPKTLEVKKPWGKFFQFTLNKQSTVKILVVNAGTRLSYQSHKFREEFWRCIKGPVKAEINGKGKILEEGDEIFIPKGAKHRLVGLKQQGQVLEISFGFFDEKDIIRYEDDYGRVH